MPIKVKVIESKELKIRNWIDTSLAVYSEKEHISIDEAKSLLMVNLKISPVQLGWWLNNNSQPSLEQGLKIAEFLGRSVNEIFKLTEV